MNRLPFTSSAAVLVQGIWEPIAQSLLPLMLAAGTPIRAGVSPGYGGQAFQSVPVFDLVEQAIAQAGPMDTCLVCSSPYRVLDAALEAIAAGVRQILIVTDEVPPLDVVKLLRKAALTGTVILGPGSPGLCVPGQFLLGSLAVRYCQPGTIGVVGRGGPLLNEAASILSQAGVGQSLMVGIGSNELVGSSLQDWVSYLDQDVNTSAIVLLGQPGGNDEEAVAALAPRLKKKLIAYVAGCSASPCLSDGVSVSARGDAARGDAARSKPSDNGSGDLGDRGLLWEIDTFRLGPLAVASHLASHLQFGPAQPKVEALQRAKVPIAGSLQELPVLLQKTLKTRRRR